MTNMTYKQLCVTMADAIEKIEGYKPGTRAYGNHNPGNLWVGESPGKFKRIFPKVPIDKEGFLIFENYAAGRKALEKDILLKVLKGMTLEKFVYTYAPPNQNNTENYIKLMTEFTGIARDKKLLDLVNNESKPA